MVPRIRGGGRVAEGASLLRTYRGNPIASSNLALPALKGLRASEGL